MNLKDFKNVTFDAKILLLLDAAGSAGVIEL